MNDFENSRMYVSQGGVPSILTNKGLTISVTTDASGHATQATLYGYCWRNKLNPQDLHTRYCASEEDRDRDVTTLLENRGPDLKSVFKFQRALLATLSVADTSLVYKVADND